MRQYQAPTDDFQQLIDEQGGVCAICKEAPGVKGFAIDHDHETGLYRGLLCGNCNLAIGNLRDDVRRMVNAVAYVLQHRGVQVDVARVLELIEPAQ